MAKFIYTAKFVPQKTQQGEIDAESAQEAINKLLYMGYFPVTLASAELSVLSDGGLSKKSVSRKEILIFTHQLSHLLTSGVTILKSLALIGDQTTNKYFKAVIAGVTGKVKEGTSLSESLSEYPGIFSRLYTSTLFAGELSGKIEFSLQHLEQHLEKEESLKNSVQQSLMYPLFVACVGIASVIVLICFVIPRLISMFQDMGQALPLPTLLLINLSVSLQRFWWLIIISTAFAWIAVKRFYHPEQGKTLIDAAKLTVPVLGKIALKNGVSRLMRALAMLVSSGIPIVSALEIAGIGIANQILKQEVIKFKEQITAGLSLSKCMHDSPHFPSLATHIIAVGEESGNLESALASIADEYQGDVDRTLKACTGLLEPVVILVMGLVVGFIVVAMLLPIFQINLMAR
jgi:type II secretory pathway component PulF